jgi:hyperpolarization activated cyclic nucleotide-gated potassium channel 2
LIQAGIESDVGGTVSGTKQSLKMLKLLRITKLFRLFRLNRLFLQIKRLALLAEEALHIRISDGFTKLLRLGVGAMVLAHWIGCFNFMLVRLHDFPPDSWIVYARLENEKSAVQWSWAFYKALAQMIMIGFETPP